MLVGGMPAGRAWRPRREGHPGLIYLPRQTRTSPSAGAHFRADCSDEDHGWERNLVISQGVEGMQIASVTADMPFLRAPG